MKNKRGVTLIALVITVIILLILAGITLYLTGGQKGIIEKAQMSGKNYIEVAKEEEVKLLSYNDEIDGYNQEKVSSMKGYGLIDIDKNTTTPILNNLYLKDSIYQYSKIDIVYLREGCCLQCLTFYPEYVTSDHNKITDSIVAENGTWGVFIELEYVNEKEFKINNWNRNANFNGIIGVIGYK